MAVVSVEELYPNRAGSEDSTSKRSYTRFFEVITDDPLDDQNVVYAGSGLPVVGDFYVTPNWTDVGSVVSNISAVNLEADPEIWMVTVEYETIAAVPGAGGGVDSAGQGGGSPTAPGAIAENPLDRPPVYKVTGQKVKNLIREALVLPDPLDPDALRATVKILNSAGMPFVPAPEDEMNLPEISITIFKPVNWLNFPLLFGEFGFWNSVNKDTWKGLPPRTVKTENVTVEEHYENGVACLKVDWRLLVKWDTWDLRLDDAGYYEKIPGPTTDPTPKMVKIIDDSGREPTEPFLLNGSGRRLLPTLADPNPQPVELRFCYKKERTFTGNIP